MKDLCGAEGIDRCHCMYENGTYSRGPFIYEEDPLNVALLYQTCNPDFCFCRGSPDVERDSRNVEMKAIMDLCPRNEMSRCLCEDNSVIKFPFDMTTLFQVCRPKRVRANTAYCYYYLGFVEEDAKNAQFPACSVLALLMTPEGYLLSEEILNVTGP